MGGRGRVPVVVKATGCDLKPVEPGTGCVEMRGGARFPAPTPLLSDDQVVVGGSVCRHVRLDVLLHGGGLPPLPFH